MAEPKRAGWNLLSAHQRRVKMWQLETPELLALAEAAKRAAPIDRQDAAFDRDLTDELVKARFDERLQALRQRISA
ncbi:MAG: hypothetical protein R3F11_10690 [Verrucomicrobiales bacterium]